MKVAIIGGGASGTLLAAQMLRRKAACFDIVIFEPRAELGLGLAYSTTCDGHLLNVPASRMSVFPDNMDHFAEFAKSNITGFDPVDFAPRKLFGKYVQHVLGEAMENKSEHSSLSHEKSKVINATKNDGGKYALETERGSFSDFDAVILALGNLPGHKPGWLHNFEINDPAVIFDPWDAKRVHAIAQDDAVLLVGAGLTAVDKLVELHERNHRGKIYAVSRHGLLPRPHIYGIFDSVPAAPPSDTVRGALHHIRENSSESWRAAIDGMRPISQDFWFKLPLAEKRRFMRHAQTLWDVHRHRMAPRISETIEAMIASGQLQILAGRLSALEHIHEKDAEHIANDARAHNDSAVVASITTRHHGEVERIRIAHIINCTGPQAALRTVDAPLLAALLKNGLISSHETGYGLNCDRDNHVIDRSGNVDHSMFAIGPLMKAVLFETVAMPEIKIQANKIAEELATTKNAAR